MIFLTPFHTGDQACIEQTLQWVKELGGAKGHKLILMPAKKIRDCEKARLLAVECFDSVEVFPDSEGIEGHPQGPNSMMRQAIWHMQTSGLGPWTFWEPDCIPREPAWADRWEAEYQGFNKPFMGEFRPASGVTPDYLTGNMVLPKDALLLAPMLSRRGLSKDGVELAFDIVAASQTLPKAHLTKLLQQVPKNPDGSAHTFPDQASLSLLRDGAILFHPCKDGSLIERLRENRSGYKTAPVITISSSAGTVSAKTSIQEEIERLKLDVSNLTRENDLLRAELLKLKSGACVSGSNVSPSRDEQEPDTERGLIASAVRPVGSNPAAPDKYAAIVAKRKATIAKKKQRIERLKATLAKKKAA